MKGLLIKDIKLMKNQSRFFLTMFIIAIILLVSNTNGMFVVSYVTLLCTFFVLSTFSYDDFDNGGVFLMTLPITRTLYAMEKYVLGLILALISWGLSSVSAFVVGYNKGMNQPTQEWWIQVALFLALAWIALAIMIPIQIKFGAEKSRIALMLLFGGIIILALGIGKGLETLNIDLTGLVEMVSNLGVGGISFIIILLVIAALAISFLISKKMMENKEY